MMHINRRNFGLGLIVTAGLAACGNGLNSNGGAAIDARVDTSIAQLLQEYPATRDLMNIAAGMLVMPLITEIGFGFGGSWGRGALRIKDATVDYYSAATVSTGIQIGAQQYSHVLFFMTQDALTEFRTADGWAAGANLEYAISNQGSSLRADSTTALSPVIAVIFAEAGLRIGATLEGTKYTRIIP